MTGHWADREPDEPLPDWMLRLQLSYAAIAARAAHQVPTSRKIPQEAPA